MYVYVTTDLVFILSCDDKTVEYESDNGLQDYRASSRE